VYINAIDRNHKIECSLLSVVSDKHIIPFELYQVMRYMFPLLEKRGANSLYFFVYLQTQLSPAIRREMLFMYGGRTFICSNPLTQIALAHSSDCFPQEEVTPLRLKPIIIYCKSYIKVFYICFINNIHDLHQVYVADRNDHQRKPLVFS